MEWVLPEEGLLQKGVVVPGQHPLLTPDAQPLGPSLTVPCPMLAFLQKGGDESLCSVPSRLRSPCEGSRLPRLQLHCFFFSNSLLCLTTV